MVLVFLISNFFVNKILGFSCHNSALVVSVHYDFFQNNSNVGTLFGIKLRGAHLKIYLRAIFMKQSHIITYINIIIERKLIVDASRKDIKQTKKW